MLEYFKRTYVCALPWNLLQRVNAKRQHLPDRTPILGSQYSFANCRQTSKHANIGTPEGGYQDVKAKTPFRLPGN